MTKGKISPTVAPAKLKLAKQMFESSFSWSEMTKATALSKGTIYNHSKDQKWERNKYKKESIQTLIKNLEKENKLFDEIPVQLDAINGLVDSEFVFEQQKSTEVIKDDQPVHSASSESKVENHEKIEDVIEQQNNENPKNNTENKQRKKKEGVHQRSYRKKSEKKTVIPQELLDPIDDVFIRKVLSAEMLKKIEHLAGINMNVTQTARLLGLDVSKFKRLFAHNETLRTSFLLGKDKSIMRNATVIAKNAFNGDLNSARYMLERLDKDVWNEKVFLNQEKEAAPDEIPLSNLRKLIEAPKPDFSDLRNEDD